MLYNGSRHFTHSSPWTKFEKSIFKQFPMISVFLICLNGNGVQKRNSPSGLRTQVPAIHLPPIHFPCHVSYSAPTLLRPCSDLLRRFFVTVTLLQLISDPAPTSPTFLVTVTKFRPCSDLAPTSPTFLVTQSRPSRCSDLAPTFFSHTITILQFRTLTPLMFVMLHPLLDPCHHSRFCG